jgi:hypothetical protein
MDGGKNSTLPGTEQRKMRPWIHASNLPLLRPGTLPHFAKQGETMKDRIKNSSIWPAVADFTKRVVWRMLAALAVLPCLGSISLHAQQTQIPTLQVCNDPLTSPLLAVQGHEVFHISSRAAGIFTGNFTVDVKVRCDLDSGYPTGFVTISDVRMTDSTIFGTTFGTISSTTIDQVTIAGIDTPTAWLSGRCAVQGDSVDGQSLSGCRYWMMLANNMKPNANPDAAPTTDVVSFLVFNNAGARIAYGTAPAQLGSGFLSIIPGP